MNEQRTLSRRSFLQGACAFGAGLGFSALSMGLAPVPVFAAASSLRTEQQTRLLMGTIVTLTGVTTDAAMAAAAFDAAFSEMERLIPVFDRHDPGSALSILNRTGSLSAAPPELLSVLDQGVALGSATGHAFNPAITPVLDLYEKHKVSEDAHDGRALAEALALAAPSGIRLGRDSVRLARTGMRLTLDGIAKGYIADAASRILLEKGLRDHMVNAGGDIRVHGLAANRLPWSIGIRHPDTDGALLTQASLTTGGIATSGNYQHAFNRNRSSNHLISHRTGRCAEAASVTVKAATAMRADALATALAVMPPGLAISHVERDGLAACYIVDRYGRSFKSRNWA